MIYIIKGEKPVAFVSSGTRVSIMKKFLLILLFCLLPFPNHDAIKGMAAIMVNEVNAASLKTGTRNFINVKNPGHGLRAATGNGRTDDTTKLQAISDWLNRNGGGVMYFPNGTYRVSYNGAPLCVRVYPGTTYVGQTKAGAVIKRLGTAPPPSSGERLFSTAAWAPRDNDKWLIISNLTFDGNGQTTDEQSSLVYMGCASTDGAKLNFNINNCAFINNYASDGIMHSNDSNGVITDCTSTDCSRGGWTLVGGNTAANVTNFISTNGHLHIEIDVAGYGGSLATNVTMTDCSTVSTHSQRILDVNLGYGPGAGSVLTFNNVTAQGFPVHCYDDGSTITFNNCNLTNYSSSQDLTLHPHNVTFNNCVLTAHYPGAGNYFSAFPVIYHSWGGGQDSGGRLTFNKCTFKADSSFPDRTACMIYGIGQNGDHSEKYDNRIILNNCIFDSSLNSAGGLATHANYGGYLEFHGCTFNVNDVNLPGLGFQTWPIVMNGLTGSGNYRLVIDNCTFNTNKYAMLLTGDSGNIVYMRDDTTSLAAAKNLLNCTYKDTYTPLDGKTGIMRKITGIINPITARPAGFCGNGGYDRFISGGVNYKCTASGPAGVATWALE